MSLNKRIKELDRQISANQKELKKLGKLELRSRQKWTKEFRAFKKAAKAVSKITRPKSKKREKLAAKIESFDARNVDLTILRDHYRASITKSREELVKLQTERTLLSEQISTENKSVDEIVTSVFRLNETVVEASTGRAEYLTRHVFQRLIGDDGKIRSQVSFTSSDGLRRVIAMTNTMTLVQGDMATEAQQLIEKFFERFQQTAAMDPNTKILYDLTHQLLIEKTKFKVGPDLYRFLSMEIDQETLPELHEAQRLLRQSIRSEKTSSYIRIKQRESQNLNWVDVRQS
jgi:hypothetical protein